MYRARDWWSKTQPALTAASLHGGGAELTTERGCSSTFFTPRETFTGFALIALVLGGIGLFGVVAHDVASRRPELALRMALGADPIRILRATLGLGASEPPHPSCDNFLGDCDRRTACSCWCR